MTCLRYAIEQVADLLRQVVRADGDLNELLARGAQLGNDYSVSREKGCTLHRTAVLGAPAGW